MKLVQVEGWIEYQHYKQLERPRWIKFYTDLLNPAKHPKYSALPDRAKLTLHHVWLIAAETGNRIPEQWLTADRLNMQTKPMLKELFEEGLISYVKNYRPTFEKTPLSLPLSLDSSKSMVGESENDPEPPKSERVAHLQWQHRQNQRREALALAELKAEAALTAGPN